MSYIRQLNLSYVCIGANLRENKHLLHGCILAIKVRKEGGGQGSTCKIVFI